jgi:GWxTD domain-containing protein
MKAKMSVILASICLVASFPPAPSAQAPGRVLPEKYRTWIDEEVVYIITPTERQVFLDLTTDRDRDFFIEAFWRHRDPSPGTDRNEYREEHDRRRAYAVKHFLGAGKPGWKTDRGKVYIILGEPRSQRSYNGLSSIYPAEEWSYQGLAIPGLPQEFNLLFFQKNGIGDFVLYDPAADGPWSLLPSSKVDPNDYIGSYQMLSAIEPELARASISLIPNETIASFPSLRSSVILQNLDTAATRTVEDLWARKLKDYRSLVEVEYSANYMASGSLLQVIQDPSGVPFVHFAIQPKAISVAEEANGVVTDLLFNGILTDLQGRTVYQFDKKIPFRFSRDQFEKLRQRPFCFADVFPILPGEYKLSVLMKNSVSKEFTTLEASVRFPSAFPAPRLSPLFLAFNATRLPAPPAVPKPFVVRDVQLYGDPEATFIAKDTLHIYAQVLGLLSGLKAKGSIKFAVEKDGAEIASNVQALAGNPDPQNFLEVFPLAKIGPGYYRAVVLLLDDGQRVLDRQARDFQVSPVEFVPRPWLQAQSLIEAGGRARVDAILGRQRLNLGDPPGALPWLEKASAADPKNAAYAYDLGRALFALDRMSDAWAVLQPLLGGAKENLDLAVLIGRTEQALGRYEEALKVYLEALAGFGQQVQILNDLGECFARLGRKDDAASAWKKSLEAEPNQAAIREKLAALEKKPPAPPPAPR